MSDKEVKIENSDVGLTTNDDGLNFNQEKSLLSKKKRIILFSLLGIFLVALLIISGTIIIKIKKDKNITQVANDEYIQEEENDSDIEIIDINYKKKDILIYNEIQSKNLSLKLKNDKKENKIDPYESTTTIKYLINIYDNKTINSMIIYYAYAGIIDINLKIRNKESILIGGEDIRENIKVNAETPVIKFSFNKKGKILTFEYNEHMNNTLINYLYEFIEKVIPEVSKSSFNNNRRLYERKYEGDKNNGFIFNEKIPKKKNKNEKETIIWKSKIESNKVKEVIGSKHLFLSFINEDVSFSIDQMINNVTSTISLSQKDSLNNEEISDKISNLLNELNFINYFQNEENQNELLNNRNLEYINTYALPIYFSYPIFNKNILGFNYSLAAIIDFVPISNSLDMNLILAINKKEYIIFSEKREINFGDIINNINDIKIKIYSIFLKEENIFQSIFNEYEEKIKDLINELNNEKEYYPLIENTAFNNELNKILKAINESTVTIYNRVYNSSIKSNQNLNSLFEDIKNNNEENVNQMIQITNSNIDSFINSNKNNLDILYDSWKEFYQNIIPILNNFQTQIENDHSFNFDIGLYYNIKDEIKYILYIFDNFVDNLKKSLNTEENKFKKYSNDIFEELIEPQLKQSEIIIENIKNNSYVIDAMNIILGTINGDKKRNDTIDNINNLRIILNSIMNEIFSQISKTYSNKIISEQFISVQNDIKLKYDEMNIQKEEIINKLKLLNKYDIDYNIYFEDFKVLYNLRDEIKKKKNESLKQNFSNQLKDLSDYFLDKNETDEINNTIINYFKNISNYLSNGDFNNSIIESEKFINIVDSIYEKYLGEDFVNKISNYYSNKNLIEKMINDYYQELNTSYSKINTSFIDINYKNHKDKYISKPKEIINQIRNISYTISPENITLYKEIEDLIINKINYCVFYSSDSIFEIIMYEFKSFLQKNLSEICEINNNTKNCEKIEENLRKVYLKYNNFNNPHIYVPKVKDDQFGIKDIIISKENNIKNSFQVITDKINLDFENDNISLFDNDNYQISKLILSQSTLQSIINISQKIFENDILSNFNPIEYTEFFKNKLKSQNNETLNFIYKLLEMFNNETSNYINNSLEKFKSDIQLYLFYGINIDEINKNIDVIANNTFILPNYLKNELMGYLYYSSGPLAKIENIFNEEINFHSITSENKYHFNEDNYRKDFMETYDLIQNEYEKRKKELFKDFDISNLINSLSNNINNYIEEYYENTLESIHHISEITKFEFLNMTISIKELYEKILENNKDKIIDKKNKSIKEIYESYFEKLKNAIFEEIDIEFNIILQRLNYEYMSTTMFYNIHSNNIDEIIYEIKFEEISKKDLINAINLFFEKINHIYNCENINEILNKSQNNLIKEYPFKVDFENELSNPIYNDIIMISQLSYNRLIEEKKLFQYYIQKLYLQQLDGFVADFFENDGKNYLILSSQNDYINNIYPNFQLISSTINENYNFFINLIETEKIQTLQLNVWNSLNEKLDIIENKLTIIPNKINDAIFTKIEVIKEVIQNELINSFYKYIEEENKKLKNKLNSKVYELIPIQFDSSYKEFTEMVFNEFNENIIKQTKEMYNTKITKDLKNITDDINNYKKYISSLRTSITNQQFLVLESYYEKLNKSTSSFKNENLEKPEKNENILSLFENKIFSFVNNIIQEYNNGKKEGEEEINKLLKSFEVGNLVDSTLVNFKSSNVKNDILTLQNKFSLTYENFKTDINNKMKDFFLGFKDKIKDINFNGFKKKLRNLEKYNWIEIEKLLNKFEAMYQNFSQKILNYEGYYNLTKKRNKNFQITYSTISSLTNNFYINKHLILQYTDDSTLDDYLMKIERDSNSIQNDSLSFIIECETRTDNFHNTIYSSMKYSWNNISKDISSSIYQILDDIYSEKLSYLNDISENNTIFQDYLLNNTVHFNSDEIINSIDINIKIKDQKYGYSLKKVNNYDFNLDVYVGSKIDITTNVNIKNLIIQTISGEVGSGKVGINANYTLHDYTVGIDGYAYLDEVNYESSLSIKESSECVFKENKSEPERNEHFKRSFSNYIE